MALKLRNDYISIYYVFIVFELTFKIVFFIHCVFFSNIFPKPVLITTFFRRKPTIISGGIFSNKKEPNY